MRERKFQFTPLREGRHACTLRTSGSCRISIHAPARGATIHGNPPIAVWRISIHAPARGATTAWIFYRMQKPLFQFTPLREGRRMDRHFVPGLYIISIHAPARGATVRVEYDINSLVFQFTPLREGRLLCAPWRSVERNFNSRPCERGDAPLLPETTFYEISIHAPARGATRRGISILT